MFASFRRLRNLSRYRRIVSVLSRHGFGSLLETMRIDRHLGLPRRIFRQKPETRLALPEHLRLALEELGPTFVKMGQILSTRPDLLPPEFITELSKLQDTVPPAHWEEVRSVIAEELAGKPEQIFRL